MGHEIRVNEARDTSYLLMTDNCSLTGCFALLCMTS